MTEAQLLRKILIELRTANLLAASTHNIFDRYREKAEKEIDTELFEETMKEMVGE